MSDPEGPAQVERSPVGTKFAWSLLVLAFPLLLGGVLRLHRFADVATWFDESVGWRLSQCSFGEVLERTEQNVHPPLHFLLLSVWNRLFGGDLATLRGYSLLWGLGTIAGAGALARACLPEAAPRQQALAGGWAALLVACSSWHIHWSQQVKMYTLGTCATVWSTWGLLRWMQSGGTGRLAAYSLLAVALALTHHYGTLTVFGQLTFALGWSVRRAWRTGSRRELAAVLLSGWAVVSLWALWLPAFLNQRGRVRESYWTREFESADLVRVWGELLLPLASLQSGEVWAWVAAEVVLVAVVWMLLRGCTGLRLCGWLAAIPFVLAAGWSIWSENVFVARYLIFAQTCLLVGLASGIASCPRALLRNGGAIVLLALTAAGAWEQRRDRTAEAGQPGMRTAVTALAERKPSDEWLLVCNPMLYVNLCVHNDRLQHVYQFDTGQPYLHFQGEYVLWDEDYRDAAALARQESDWVWTLDAAHWHGLEWSVPLPEEWVLQEEQWIAEWYATLVIRSYRRVRLDSAREATTIGAGQPYSSEAKDDADPS